MTDTHTLRMPIKRFWAMVTTIPRIEAQRALITLTVTNGAQSQDGAGKARDGLQKQMGRVYIDVPKRDADATKTLQSLQG